MEECDRREVEKADYVLDVETTRKRMRGRAGGESSNTPKSERFDDDFVVFLERLDEFWESEDEDEDDPSYIAFLENLKEDGNAYMCCVSMEHGVLSPIMYEEDCDSVPVPVPEKRTRRVTWLLDDSNAKSHHHHPDLSDEYRKRLQVVGSPKPRNRHIHFGQVNTNFSSLRGHPISASDVSDQVNDTYKEFLDHLYVEAGFLVFKHGNRPKIVYENEPEPFHKDTKLPTSTPTKSTQKPSNTVSNSSPSTSIPRPETPPSREMISTTNSHLPIMSVYETEQKYKRSPSYWKKLHDKLRKPYSQKEYDELMKVVSVQTPNLEHRESRSGGTKRQGKLGKSYLQCHSDLHTEIKKAKSDRYKVLNLLRMLVYYLKKCPSGGGIPWKDDYTKTIMPGSK